MTRMPLRLQVQSFCMLEEYRKCTCHDTARAPGEKCTKSPAIRPTESRLMITSNFKLKQSRSRYGTGVTVMLELLVLFNHRDIEVKVEFARELLKVPSPPPAPPPPLPVACKFNPSALASRSPPTTPLPNPGLPVSVSRSYDVTV